MARKNRNSWETYRTEYLIIKCKPLGDQWECDAHRIPICITEDYTPYIGYGYEIYKIRNDGKIEQLKYYEEEIKN